MAKKLLKALSGDTVAPSQSPVAVGLSAEPRQGGQQRGRGGPRPGQARHQGLRLQPGGGRGQTPAQVGGAAY